MSAAFGHFTREPGIQNPSIGEHYRLTRASKVVKYYRFSSGMV